MLLICGKSSIFFANKKLFGQKFADFKILSYLCTRISDECNCPEAVPVP